jgi:AcrR family transcriptional regulator
LRPSPEPGLRERKKIRTRSAIQHEALRLVREQGYEQTTVSQIAAAADVSESTFFRYFRSKEDLFFTDDFDDVLVESFREQPPELSPLQALRAAIRDAFSDLTEFEVEDSRQRTELVMKVPELRQAMAGRLLEEVDILADLIAQRLGKPHTDLTVRALAGALVGTMVAVALPLSDTLSADYVDRIDRALGELETALQGHSS